MEIWLMALLAGVGIVLIWLVLLFNGLIRMRNRVDEAWSDIDVQLKRRHDLIPNLINAVKGYAKHEKGVFEAVTKARSNAINAKSPGAHAKAENMLTEALKSVFAVAEAYPDLKASDNFMHLQRELTDAEDKIQAARRFYNGNVRDFNTKIQVFPSNLVAGILGFKKYEFFEAQAGERENVKVAF
jgi:LemA protein